MDSDQCIVSNLAKCFTTPELMRWPGIEELYGTHLRQTKVFGSKGVAGVQGDIDEEDKLAKGDVRWEELHMRVVEHVSDIDLQSRSADLSAKNTDLLYPRIYEPSQNTIQESQCNGCLSCWI